MSRLSLSALLLLFSWLAEGQLIVNGSLNDFYDDFKTARMMDRHRHEETVEGSPYDLEKFTSGDIRLANQQQYSGIPMNYNIYSGQVEFINDKGDNMVFDIPEMIEFVVIGQEKYIYSPYSMGGKIFKGFFVVLEEGAALLLQKKNVMLKPAESPQAYKDAVPARFVRTRDDFYLRIPPSEAKKVANRKDLDEALPAVPPELDQFIRRENIRFNRKEELVKLVAEYNRLAGLQPGTGG